MWEYAVRATIFEDNILPYLLALLEWTLPLVCYMNDKQKQLAIYSSAFIYEKIKEMENI